MPTAPRARPAASGSVWLSYRRSRPRRRRRRQAHAAPLPPGRGPASRRPRAPAGAAGTEHRSAVRLLTRRCTLRACRKAILKLVKRIGKGRARLAALPQCRLPLKSADACAEHRSPSRSRLAKSARRRRQLSGSPGACRLARRPAPRPPRRYSLRACAACLLLSAAARRCAVAMAACAALSTAGSRGART